MSDVLEFLGRDVGIRGMRITGILLVAWILTRLVRRFARRIERRVADQTTPMRSLQRAQTLAHVLSATGIIVIWILATLYVLVELGLNLAPLIAGVGVAGLAIGFGAQNLVRDLVAGFFILLEDQYGVGDNVEINQVAPGKVEVLTLRVTGVRALDGTVHYVSNGNITLVANRSMEWARAVVDVGVAYKEKSSRVREVLGSAAAAAFADETTGALMRSEPEILGVEMLGDSEVVWRMVVETKPGKQWKVGRALRERVKTALDEAGVEIPFPHRVLVQPEGRPQGR